MGSSNGNALRLRHRRWVYGGLDVPEGKALVRGPGEPAEEPRLPQQLLVMGDEVARAVGAPLMRLARDAEVGLLVVSQAGHPAEAWLEHGWIVSAVGRCLPDLVIFAFLAGQDPATIERLAMATGAPALWLSPEPAHATERVTPVHLATTPDTMAPTAFGYAAWAGKAWETMSEMSSHG